MPAPPKSCAFHPTQTLVNFCRNPQCLLPMCPSCIKVHSAQHVRLNTHGNYDCLPDLYLEVESQLHETLRSLLSNGEKLQQVMRCRQNEKEQFINKLKDVRGRIIEQINKYIDGVQQQLLNQLSTSQSTYMQQTSTLNTHLSTLTSQAQSQLQLLSSQKSLKYLISHISSNMHNYYSYNINDISAKIDGLKNSYQINIEKQFKINSINQIFKVIGDCYNGIFADGGKMGRNGGNGGLWMNGSGVSGKSKEGSTQGSFKKVI